MTEIEQSNNSSDSSEEDGTVITDELFEALNQENVQKAKNMVSNRKKNQLKLLIKTANEARRPRREMKPLQKLTY